MSIKTYIFSDNFSGHLEAINRLTANGIRYSSFTPVPISLDSKKINNNKIIQILALFFGVFGFLIAGYFQYWVGVSYYKMNLGGKPFFGIITSIPISFEIAVLFAGIALFITLFVLVYQSFIKIEQADREIIEKYASKYFIIIIGEEF